MISSNYFLEIINKLSAKFFNKGNNDVNLLNISEIINIILFKVVNNLKSDI